MADWTQRISILSSSGYLFYCIPAGTELFRADPAWYDICKTGGKYGKEDPAWFGTQSTAEIYGRAIKFQTTAGLCLLAMDNPGTIRKLMEEFPGVAGSLKGTFPLVVEGQVEKVHRESDAKIDKKIATEICLKNNSPGWAHLVMREMGTTQGIFNAEVMLCKVDFVKCTGVVAYESGKETELKREEMRIQQKFQGQRRVVQGLGMAPRRLF